MKEFSLFLLLAASGFSKDVRNVLVVVDGPAVLDSHSAFINQLNNNFNTVVKMSDDNSLVLKRYGEYLFQDLVVLAPAAEQLGSGLEAADIIQFIDDGGNVLMAAGAGEAGTRAGELAREVASEVGVELDEDGTNVIDHLNFDVKDSGHHTLVVADPANLINSDRIVGKQTESFLYRGLGMVTDPSNPLVLNILAGASTTYSHHPEDGIKEYPHAVGRNTALIAGLQARNNARVVISGSMDFFSDEFFAANVEKVGMGSQKSGNAALAAALVSWCFQQTGVIRIDSVSHKIAGTADTPAYYTIRQHCEYTLKISEYVRGEWVPFKADDVQMEFVRIDPFVRQRMINKNGILTAKFKVPDVYGVFKFTVDYARLGLTRISTSTQVSVHPLMHDQYERFIPSAYPYYASSFSMMAGVFVFALVFLYTKDEQKTKGE